MNKKIFDEFLKKGIVKRQTPEKSRIRFLIAESEKNYGFLLNLINKMGIDDFGANNCVKICYDIIMGILRAKMLADGYKSSGFGANEAEVSYLSKIGFSENDVGFLDKIRFFRNGMLYYGTALDKEYAEKVIKFTKKIYPKLKKLAENKI